MTTRHLPLEGTFNVRDVGGYPTRNGGTTRWRTLLRSDALNRLGDQDALRELGLRTVVDLRERTEAGSAPDALDGLDLTIRHLPVYRRESDQSTVLSHSTDLTVLYEHMIDRCGPGLTAAVIALAEPGALPALVHCKAGKDRTGLVIGLALALAGVPADLIAEDYALTARYLGEDFLAESLKQGGDWGVDDETWAAVVRLHLDSPAELMLASLRRIDEQHGGVEEYLRRNGMTDRQMSDLRAALVVNEKDRTMSDPLYTLIQLSDTHIVPEGELLHGSQDTITHVRAALAAVEAADVKPAAILLTGDLADTGSPEAYRRLRAEVDAAVEKIGAPALYVMGNHDERAAFRTELLDSDVPVEQNHDYVHRVGDLRIVVLDSTTPGHHHGVLDAEQLDWLRTELAEPAPAGTIVVLHHPPIPSPLAVMDLVGNRSSAALAEALRGTDVRMVLSGHSHHPSTGTLAGIPVWVAGAVAYSSDTLAPNGWLRGLPGANFTRIDVFEDTVVATVVPVLLGEVPPVYEMSADVLEQALARMAEH